MRRPEEYEIEYVDECAFEAELDALPAKDAQRLVVFMGRMTNPQHHVSRGDDYKKLHGKEAEEVGLREARVHFGPGYRVYFAHRGDRLIIAGVGTKRTQDKDIKDASEALSQWDQREQATTRHERAPAHQAGRDQRRGPRGHR